jgi:hypothetical protein
VDRTRRKEEAEEGVIYVTDTTSISPPSDGTDFRIAYSWQQVEDPTNKEIHPNIRK